MYLSISYFPSPTNYFYPAGLLSPHLPKKLYPNYLFIFLLDSQNILFILLKQLPSSIPNPLLLFILYYISLLNLLYLLLFMIRVERGGICIVLRFGVRL